MLTKNGHCKRIIIVIIQIHCHMVKYKISGNIGYQFRINVTVLKICMHTKDVYILYYMFVDYTTSCHTVTLVALGQD